MNLEDRLENFVRWLDSKGVSINSEPFNMEALIKEYVRTHD